jgi:hypothetical protein
MIALVWAALGLLGVFLSAALGDLVSEEIRGWLDLVPRAILRLAAVQLDPDLRESIYEGEWLPDLIYELRGAESRPITRLIRGIPFALGLLMAARRISRERTGATVARHAAGTTTLRDYPFRLWLSYNGQQLDVRPVLAAMQEALGIDDAGEILVAGELMLKLHSRALAAAATLWPEADPDDVELMFQGHHPAAGRE